MNTNTQTPDLEALTREASVRQFQAPLEIATVAGYRANTDIIPLEVDLGSSITLDASSPLAQATATIMRDLIHRYGGAPGGYSTSNPTFLSYSRTFINEGPREGTQLGVGVRYTWSTLPRNLNRLNDEGERRDFLHLTIVEHPQYAGVFVYQVVEGGSSGFRKLFDAGMYSKQKDGLVRFMGLPYSTQRTPPIRA